MSTVGAYDLAEEQLLDVARRFSDAAASVDVPIPIVGALAAFLHVDEREPIAARLTPEVDVAILKWDLDRLQLAAGLHGFAFEENTFRLRETRPRSIVRIVFAAIGAHPERLRGLAVATVADLVRMELSTFRLKNKLYIQDMDGVGLITPEIEAGLSPLLRDRLAEIRATE